MQKPKASHSKALRILPIMVVAIALAIFVGYNLYYAKEDVLRDQSESKAEPTVPVPG